MRILVEDDMSLRKAYRAAEGAFAVDWIHDGGAALRIAQQDEFDLIMLDLGLPHVDGIEVIRQLRNRGNRVPILVLSAESGLPTARSAWTSGPTTIWASPSTPQNYWLGYAR
jgi:DNA-binding response OmpR family regulator